MRAGMICAELFLKYTKISTIGNSQFQQQKCGKVIRVKKVHLFCLFDFSFTVITFFFLVGFKNKMFEPSCLSVFLLDIDECQDGSHMCRYSQICQNTVGGYGCACPRGYRSQGVGLPCLGRTFLLPDWWNPSLKGSHIDSNMNLITPSRHRWMLANAKSLCAPVP